jgi:SAM-dependent methyltransferase
VPPTEYGPGTYGDRIADVYDRLDALPEDTAEAAEFLAGLAGEGPALELGIGTGRVALPLAARGVEVHGIDASERMVAKLRSKPGGSEIPVTIGDFAGVEVKGQYQLIFVVFNTFFALLTQEDQVRCFAGVADHLETNGTFVIQAFMPDLTLFNRGSRVAVTDLEVDKAKLDLARLDPVAQAITSQHVVLEDDRITTYPVKLRYAWPSELDLMARLAGLRLRERWSGWDRKPFEAGSGQHVSVYEKPKTGPTTLK